MNFHLKDVQGLELIAYADEMMSDGTLTIYLTSRSLVLCAQ